MNAEIYWVHDIMVAKLTGALDSTSAKEIRKQLEPVAKSRIKLIMDMTQVTLTFSAGIIMIYSICQDITNHGGRMILVGINRDMEITLQITRAQNYFTICRTLEEGLQAMNL